MVRIDEKTDEYVCPDCGNPVPQDAWECPSCGSQFNKPAEDSALPAPKKDLEVPNVCESCGKELPEGETECPDCKSHEGEAAEETKPEGEVPKMPESACPVCGSKRYTPETGDLVKCDECGNAYVIAPTPAEGFFKGWKWKFWIGLTFIVVGDFGFALASYVHNVLKWTFLGDMYLGYGWIDSLLGVLGIVLFAVGIMLFAWSFKREREVKCDSCGEYVIESELIPTEDPHKAPSDEAVKAALGEIEQELTCPNCGVPITLFDEKCPSCGQEFLQEEAPAPTEEAFEYAPAEQVMAPEQAVDEAAMEPAPEMADEAPSMEKMLLDDISTLADKPEAQGIECPECGIMADPGTTECPVCGAKLEGK